MAEIADIETRPLQAQGVATHGIIVAVNSGDAGVDGGFVEALAKTIALHRMCSPPDTSLLLVSVIGAFDAAGFREDWSRAVAGPSAEMQALRFFLGQMSSAVLVHGKQDGSVLQEVSLKTD